MHGLIKDLGRLVDRLSHNILILRLKAINRKFLHRLANRIK